MSKKNTAVKEVCNMEKIGIVNDVLGALLTELLTRPTVNREWIIKFIANYRDKVLKELSGK